MLLNQPKPLRDAEAFGTPTELEGVVGVEQRREDERSGGADDRKAGEEAYLRRGGEAEWGDVVVRGGGVVRRGGGENGEGRGAKGEGRVAWNAR